MAGQNSNQDDLFVAWEHSKQAFVDGSNGNKRSRMDFGSVNLHYEPSSTRLSEGHLSKVAGDLSVAAARISELKSRFSSLQQKLSYHQSRAAEVAEGMERVQQEINIWTKALVSAKNNAIADHLAGHKSPHLQTYQQQAPSFPVVSGQRSPTLRGGSAFVPTRPEPRHEFAAPPLMHFQQPPSTFDAHRRAHPMPQPIATKPSSHNNDNNNNINQNFMNSARLASAINALSGRVQGTRPSTGGPSESDQNLIAALELLKSRIQLQKQHKEQTFNQQQQNIGYAASLGSGSPSASNLINLLQTAAASHDVLANSPRGVTAANHNNYNDTDGLLNLLQAAVSAAGDKSPRSGHADVLRQLSNRLLELSGAKNTVPPPTAVAEARAAVLNTSATGVDKIVESNNKEGAEEDQQQQKDERLQKVIEGAPPEFERMPTLRPMDIDIDKAGGKQAMNDIVTAAAAASIAAMAAVPLDGSEKKESEGCIGDKVDD